MAACACYYLDDTGILDLASAGGSAQEAVNCTYTGLGCRLDPKKQQPIASQCHFLGVLLHLGRVVPDLTLVVDLKEGLRPVCCTALQSLGRMDSVR